MKRYKFTLDAVRRVRRIQEDQKKAALAMANGAVQRAKVEVESRTNAYNTSLNSMTGATEASSFIARRYLNELAGQAVISARQAQADAEIFANERRDEWSQSAAKVKILDKLDERRHEEYLVEYERDVVKDTDDIIVSRHSPKPVWGNS